MTKQPTVDEILLQSFKQVSYKTRVSSLPDRPYEPGGEIDVNTELGFTKQALKAHIEAIVREVTAPDEPHDTDGKYSLKCDGSPCVCTADYVNDWVLPRRYKRFQQVMEREYKS